jgi:hypothetical protein
MEPHFFLPPVVPNGTDEFDEFTASAENVKLFTNSASRNARACVAALSGASDAPFFSPFQFALKPSQS